MNSDQHHFEHMDIALDAANRSDHPNTWFRIGASLVQTDGKIFSAPNFCPPAILDQLGWDQKIGGASTTIHAEFATLSKGTNTNNAALYVTHPICPNCTKDIIDAGLREVFIDSVIYNKPNYPANSRPFFDTLSMGLFSHYDVEAYLVDRASNSVTRITPDTDFKIHTPIIKIETEDIHQKKFEEIILERVKTKQAIETATLITNGSKSQIAFFDQNKVKNKIRTAFPQNFGKYSPKQRYLSGLFMQSNRLGYNMNLSTIYSEKLPSARELIDAVGIGVTRLLVSKFAGDTTKDEEAANILMERHILDIEVV